MPGELASLPEDLVPVQGPLLPSLPPRTRSVGGHSRSLSDVSYASSSSYGSQANTTTSTIGLLLFCLLLFCLLLFGLLLFGLLLCGLLLCGLFCCLVWFVVWFVVIVFVVSIIIIVVILYGDARFLVYYS